MKKFITDSNAVAQEKGLEAALTYVENCDAASKVTSDCVEGIVTKCVAAPKTKTKDLAKQIVLTMFAVIDIDIYKSLVLLFRGEEDRILNNTCEQQIIWELTAWTSAALRPS